VVVAPNDAAVVQQLSLAEIRLYDAIGNFVPLGSSSAVLSTVAREASLCIDSNVATTCATDPSSSNPVLRVYYECPLGSTALSTVVVHSDQSRSAELSKFTLLFVNAANLADRPGYMFSGSQQAYTVSTTGTAQLVVPCSMSTLGARLNGAHLLHAGSCGVIIRPTYMLYPLGLADVRLFDAAGAQLQPNQLEFTMSSLYSLTSGYEVANCKDGYWWSSCWANTPSVDKVQTLRIAYQCKAGGTALSRVVVTAAYGYASNLGFFTLDFVNAVGAKDRASFTFSGALDEYDIPTKRARPCLSHAAALHARSVVATG
jgi:hypothetical protein